MNEKERNEYREKCEKNQQQENEPKELKMLVYIAARFCHSNVKINPFRNIEK